MALQINIHELTKSFSAKTIFESLTFSIESGDRIGLIGPNGAGKSTLLKILAKEMDHDSGIISYAKGLKVAYLKQVAKFDGEATILKTITHGKYSDNLYEIEQKARELISKLQLPSEDFLVKNLSGGLLKRVSLARELVTSPELLLLDEPTNHLDVETILWLENFLKGSNFSTVTITHDRAFLQNVSNKIIEINKRYPNGLFQVKGEYLDFLQLREEKISTQEKEEQKLKNRFRRESEWLKQGAKARTTKQQARIGRADDLEKKVQDLSFRNQNLKVNPQFQSSEKQPKKLIALTDVTKSYEGKLIIPPLSLLITPKTRLGLLGENGCGKTTLLKLLSNNETPDSGTIEFSENLNAIFFEQNRTPLDLSKTVKETISPDGDYVDFHDKKVHVCSYLTRYLFTKDHLDLPVKKLSGGEQSRLFLAMLMLKKANILILDEPTNDLDIDTLDVLQEILIDFPGAIILVTHDRYFLDQVTNEILVFEKEDENKNKDQVSIHRFHGLNQWLNFREEKSRNTEKPNSFKDNKNDLDKEKIIDKKKKGKLSFNEQKEFDDIENKILKSEETLSHLEKEGLLEENSKNQKKLNEITLKMSKLTQEIEYLYHRWSELSDKQNGSN